MEVTLDMSLNLICLSHDPIMLSAVGTLTSDLPLHLILSAPLLSPAAELPAGHAFLSSIILFLLRCIFVLLYSSSFCYSKPKVYTFHYDF